MSTIKRTIAGITWFYCDGDDTWSGEIQPGVRAMIIRWNSYQWAAYRTSGSGLIQDEESQIGVFSSMTKAARALTDLP